LKTFSKPGKFGKKDFGKPAGRGPKRFGGGGFDRSGPREFNRPSFDRQLFKATCDNCGASCEVPFKPSGEKPVYCRDCFRKMDNSDSPRTGQFRSSGYSDSRRPAPFRKSEYSAPRADSSVREFEQLNQKLDKILKILEGE
jgi:CxxC-x17-CxxC domain-containing protein